jgi:hypothetical protein
MLPSHPFMAAKAGWSPPPTSNPNQDLPSPTPKQATSPPSRSLHLNRNLEQVMLVGCCLLFFKLLMLK